MSHKCYVPPPPPHWNPKRPQLAVFTCMSVCDCVYVCVCLCVQICMHMDVDCGSKINLDKHLQENFPHPLEWKNCQLWHASICLLCADVNSNEWDSSCIFFLRNTVLFNMIKLADIPSEIANVSVEVLCVGYRYFTSFSLKLLFPLPFFMPSIGSLTMRWNIDIMFLV